MDDFARSAEAEATCIRKVNHLILVERFLKFSIISVKYIRGSSCEISEEYDVKPDYTVVAS